MRPVLHVSQLKKKMGEGVLISSELSVMGEFGRVKVYPFAKKRRIGQWSLD